ncbi:MAG: hypothetical protein HY940_01095 [Gammaproteobacteria bacterium]|nr:hypothetical protein [Gammaproteobacteria bacterium]
MLRCGSQIRLTRDERRQLVSLVAADPGAVRHAQDLERFVDFHLERIKQHDSPVADFTRRRLQSLLPEPTPEGCADCPAVECRRRRA